MKPKTHATDLISQQKKLNTEMYSYAKEDRRDRRAYLKQLGNIGRVLMDVPQSFTNGNGNNNNETSFPIRKGMTRKQELRLLKQNQVK
jgi:hypothetical protein